MDQQQRIEGCIDELYAVQKQAGDRMVGLTKENKWVLERQERNVTKSIDYMKKCSKILIGGVLAVCIIGGAVLGWLIYRWTRDVNAGVYYTYTKVERVEKIQEELKGILEKLQQDKKEERNFKSVHNVEKSSK